MFVWYKDKTLSLADAQLRSRNSKMLVVEVNTITIRKAANQRFRVGLSCSGASAPTSNGNASLLSDVRLDKL
jgi:hypothetical protein